MIRMLHIGALLVGLALAGCKKDETVTGYGGADILWVLQSIDGKAFTARANLSFPTEGEIAGQAPCNRFFGSQTAPYPWFSTGPLGATRMACPELEAEGQYLQALEEMTQVEVLGDTMILSNDAGRKMVFKAET